MKESKRDEIEDDYTIKLFEKSIKFKEKFIAGSEIKHILEERVKYVQNKNYGEERCKLELDESNLLIDQLDLYLVEKNIRCKETFLNSEFGQNESLSADPVLNGLRRYIARRGNDV